MEETGRLRFLAPVAIVVALLAVVIVVSSVGTGSSSKSAKPTVTTASKKAKRPPKFYIVKPGDNLGAIADKTDVPIEDIKDLNPDIDPQMVRPGQRLRLRR